MMASAFERPSDVEGPGADEPGPDGGFAVGE